MPVYPAGIDAHFDVPLSNFAVSAFAREMPGMVGQALFPEITVEKESDKYYTIDKGAWLRIPNTARGRRGTANKIYFQTSSDAYFCEQYALATDFPLEDLANADRQIMLRENGVQVVVNGLRRDEEVRCANIATSISNVGSGVSLSGTNKWGDPSSSPIGDVRTGHAFMERQTGGLKANTLVIDSDTLRILRTHPELLDMYKYTAGGEITDAQLLQAFDVERMLIARGKKENMAEGSTSSSITNVWGNIALLAHMGQAAGLMATTPFVRFRWAPPIYPAGLAVKTARYDQAGQNNVEVVEAGYFQDEKVVARDLAYLIKDTL